MSGRRRRQRIRREEQPDDDQDAEEDAYFSGVSVVTLLLVFGFVFGILYYLYSSEQRPDPPQEVAPRNPLVCRQSTGTGVTYKSEEQVRCILQEIFGVEFKTTRKIEWLKNDRTGRPLEFDGYAPSLRMPFEHNGIGHVQPEFGMSAQDLLNLQYRDARKDMLTLEYLGSAIIRTGYRINVDGDIEYDKDLRAAVHREITAKYPQYIYLLT